MIQVYRIDVATTYPLRISVLRNGIAKDYQFVGDNDKETFHVGAFLNEQCIGIASCMKKENLLFEVGFQYQLRGMAVEPLMQGKGVGKAIVEKTLVFLEERKCAIVWCNARLKAVDFYKKMGFLVVGEKFMIPKVGLHYLMYKKL